MTNKEIRQLAAIMFADMVGYTAQMQTDEAGAKSQRDRQRTVIEAEVTAANGLILQYFGDGTLCVFGSAIDAVNCAIRIQTELQKEPKVLLRIGLHVADIVYDDEGVYGDGVNVASRIESIATPGSILVSDRIYDDIKNHNSLSAKSMGEFNFKNVQRPMEVFAIDNAGIPVPDIHTLENRTAKSDKSVAVLPFVNMSSESDNEYFSDGISEEIINSLTRVKGLRVTSRTSAFSFKGKNLDVREIGEQLNVNTVLEGSVRKAGNRVRITAQLIKISDGFHLWSENFDRQLEDIFEVQDEIAAKITEELKRRFDISTQKSTHSESPVNNIEAYNVYLKGLWEWNKSSPRGVRNAIENYRKAIELEPQFALAYSGIAGGYAYLGATGQMLPMKAYPLAKEAAKKALEIDDKQAESHLALAVVRMFYEWDWRGARESFKMAIDLNPGSAQIHSLYSMYLQAIGKFDDAIREARVAARLDPLAMPIQQGLGRALFAAQRFEDAEQIAKHILNLDDTFRSAHEYLGWTYLAMGKNDQAIASFERYQEMTGNELYGQAGLGYAYAVSGYRDKAKKCLERIQKRQAMEPDKLFLLDSTVILVGLERWDEAFESLEKLIEQRMGVIVFLATSPQWKALHADPRFDKIIDKIGLKDYYRKNISANYK